MDIIILSNSYDVIGVKTFTGLDKNKLPTFYLDGIQLCKDNNTVIDYYSTFLNDEFYNFIDTLFIELYDNKNVNTISFIIDDTIIELDFMNNLTSFASHPDKIIEEINKVKSAIELYYDKKYKIPEQKNIDWYNKQLNQFIKYDIQSSNLMSIIHNFKK